ncbi:DnaD domain-containing protein, partial [Chloroflexota bacterium]
INTEELPNIFTMYEQNIGMLTPIIADELKDAEKLYPVDWIQDAIKEASTNNKRNWRYISKILENWATEGKNDGTHRRYSTQKAGSDKYIRQKYGNLVKR